ncbi:SH3 and cysteine-rich domain-containing protein 2-like [Lampris incognitus]|uniref:SH3 and cysteine-rich domain-containing protein 2-like n=1 Tax=Lampris incognitus TaxID=2546036 RepID=UPI0024B593D6|nr:SH3 and cysteine-rich domain-containing protein 2-like [Lampris incognitus]
MLTENSDADSEPELQRSPSTVSIQPVASKLQRLKRSLSFKTLMRSKSVENFFQRSYSDARLPPDFITDPPPPSPPLTPGSPLGTDCSPSISPSLSPNPSICSHSPSLSPSASLPGKTPRPQVTHYFQEHVFRKPTNCQHCKHMIVGNSKQALRCRTCKLAAHLWCTSELSQLPCHGKSGAFKRNFSSPVLVNDQLAVVKEVQPSQEAGRARVDPVYAALRYGTSLAQMSRSSFGSVSESPTRSLGEGGEEREQRQCSIEEEITAETGVLPLLSDASVPEGGAAVEEEDGISGQTQTPVEESVVKVPKHIEVRSIHTYVALYRFLPQEQNDLELHSDPYSREKQEDNEGYMKLSSGKKRGLVPAVSIEEI